MASYSFLNAKWANKFRDVLDVMPPLFDSRNFSQGKKAWRIKGEADIFTVMEVKSCRVTISDMEGVAHTVEVTAALSTKLLR
jgi:hypothetical protein